MMAVYNSIMLSDVRSGFRIDSEFYKKEFIEKDLTLSKLGTLPLWRIAKVTDGEHGSVSFVKNGIKYLTAEHIKQGFVDHNGVRFVSSEVDQRNARARVNEGDVLVSIKGTLGEIALAEKNLLPANMNRDVAIIKLYSGAPSGAYITPFLRSKFGLFQLSREGSGGVQQMITLERLRCVLIPTLADKLQNEIASLHQKGLTTRQKSVSLYTKAQHLLESELGLDKLNFKKPVGYTARFSELGLSRRADSEFYNPELRYLWQNLSTRFEMTAISKFASVLKFSNPTYGMDGMPIVTQKHLRKISPEGYDYELRTTDLWQRTNPSAILQDKDLLFYSVGAYLGKTNVWLNSDAAVPASFITLLRCRDADDAGFLQVLLNSKYGILQSKCFQSGTSQQYIYPKDIRKFLVPEIDDNIKKRLHKLVINSFSKELEAKRLLEQAKTRVEQLIEKAAA